MVIIDCCCCGTPHVFKAFCASVCGGHLMNWNLVSLLIFTAQKAYCVPMDLHKGSPPAAHTIPLPPPNRRQMFTSSHYSLFRYIDSEINDLSSFRTTCNSLCVYATACVCVSQPKLPFAYAFALLFQSSTSTKRPRYVTRENNRFCYPPPELTSLQRCSYQTVIFNC